MIKIVDLIKNKKIKIENITNRQIKKNNNLIIQNGIGDLLLIISLISSICNSDSVWCVINIIINFKVFKHFIFYK